MKNNVAADKGRKQGSSTVLVSGILAASGYASGEKGGTIELLGDQVGLLNVTLMAAVVLKEGASASADELREFLAPQFAKWWLPDRVEFVNEIRGRVRHDRDRGSRDEARFSHRIYARLKGSRSFSS